MRLLGIKIIFTERVKIVIWFWLDIGFERAYWILVLMSYECLFMFP